MGALATSWDDAELEGAKAEQKLCRLVPNEAAGQEEAPEKSPRWNVLAEELVSYPPLSKRIWMEERPTAQSERARCYANAWLDAELDNLAERRRRALAGYSARQTPLLSPAPRRSAVEQQDGPSYLSEPPRPRATRVSSPARRARPKTRLHLAGSRGLRRLLPGVATLAVLGSLWFGVGALATTAHGTPIVRLPGSVPVAGGYAYTVQPGDTLWSIASRLEPGADPRPLVDRLQAELHGRPLLPGERLVLPR